jgi:sensor histidine kinase YesM
MSKQIAPPYIQQLLSTRARRKTALILAMSFTFGLTFFISQEFSLRLGPDDLIGFLLEIILFTLQIEIIYRLRTYFDHRFFYAPVSLNRYSLELMCVLVSSIMLISVLIILPVHLLFHILDIDKGAVKQPDYTIMIRQLYLLPLTFTVLVYILLSAYYAVKNLNQLELEAERLQKQRMQQLFENLRNQVNPQFLFNSLRSLSTLIYRDKDGAVRFVDELSAVYRYILDHRDKELVELHKELTFIRSYLFLLSTRHEQMQCNIIEKGNAHGLYLPPQTLQMVLDTIIRQYTQSQLEVLRIEIEANKDYLIVTSTRLAQGTDRNPLLGLREIINRYRFLTERKIAYKTTDAYFTLHIPLLEVEYVMA